MGMVMFNRLTLRAIEAVLSITQGADHVGLILGSSVRWTICELLLTTLRADTQSYKTRRECMG